MACHSALEAHDLICAAWLEVNVHYGAGERFLRRLRDRRLCAEHGWKDLDSDPCYWDSWEQPSIRIHLHQDGSIVIQRFSGEAAKILYAQTGAGERTRLVTQQA